MFISLTKARAIAANYKRAKPSELMDAYETLSNYRDERLSSDDYQLGFFLACQLPPLDGYQTGVQL